MALQTIFLGIDETAPARAAHVGSLLAYGHQEARCGLLLGEEVAALGRSATTYHLLQVAASGERLAANGGNAVGQAYLAQGSAVEECPGVYLCERCGQRQLAEPLRAQEGAVADGGDALGHEVVAAAGIGIVEQLRAVVAQQHSVARAERAVGVVDEYFLQTVAEHEGVACHSRKVLGKGH